MNKYMETGDYRRTQNRMLLGSAITAIALGVMLLAQSIQYKELEQKLADETANADYLAQRLFEVEEDYNTQVGAFDTYALEVMGYSRDVLTHENRMRVFDKMNKTLRGCK